MSRTTTGRITQQPASVWALTFATAVSFVGIGLVSPILPTIAESLQATAFESMLLFTTYLFVTACTMFFAGVISARIGIRTTLVTGMIIIVVFASMAGLSDTIGQVIGLRAGWGFGNALFVTMALASIVGASTGGSASAIILYEAAVGFGMALGPLVGGTLGTISWRAPFLGTAVLMTIAATTVIAFVKPLPKTPAEPITAGFRALAKKPLLLWSLASFMVNFTIVCLLAYAPHAVANAAEASGVGHSSLMLGTVFFGWGTALAIFSLILPTMMIRHFGLVPAGLIILSMMAVAFGLLALNAHHLIAVIMGIVILGGLQGAANTMFTEGALNCTELPRHISSSAFSATRFFGGAIFPLVSAPCLALWGAAGPFWAGLLAVVLAVAVLIGGYRLLPGPQRRRGTLLRKVAARRRQYSGTPGA